MVKRFDLVKLDNLEVLPTGFLKFPVFAARTGIQLYKDSQGNVIREFRPPEEVFSNSAMASLRTAPLTNNHPKEMVDPQNAKDLMVGFTTDTVEKVKDKFLKTHVVVTDKQAIEDIRSGKVEVSMGYDVELDETPGVFDGKNYDMVQRNIVHNHIALVDRGRAGPEVRLRLDGTDAVLVTDQEDTENKTKQEDRKMPKVKIGDREFEMNKDVAEAIKGELKRLNSEINSKKDAGETSEEVDKLQAKVDHLESELEKAKGKENKMDAETFRKELIKRRSIEKTAEHCLSKENAEKMDEMSNHEIMKAVIEAETPNVKLDEKSETYIEARFDQIADTLNVSEDQTKKAGKEVTEQRKEDAKNVDKENGDDEVTEAREASMKKDSALWQEPTATMKTN